jgi:aminocarboxymuconate-semialdehyde decarboxylase
MFNYNAQPKDTLFISRFLNDHIHRCVQGNPDRFVGLGTLPMQDPALAVVELKRCMEELGFAGVQIGSRINQWNLDEPKLDAFWAEAERLQAAVFIHPWDMDATRAPKYWLPWLVGMPSETTTAICSVIFSGVLTRFPRLKLAFAHGGGQFAFTLGRIEKGFLCRPDLVAVDNNVNPRDFVGKFWVDSLVHDPKSLKFLVDLVGSNRVCLGTDYPFPLGEDHPGKCTLQADLGEKATNDIFHNSALEFLGISRDEARRRFGKDIKN